MASFNELSSRNQFLVLLFLAVALVFAAEYTVLYGEMQDNQRLQDNLTRLQQANQQLRPLAGQLTRLRQQNVLLEQRWVRVQVSVPAQAATDDLIRQIEVAARESGVALRGLTAKPTVARPYYTEAPYQLMLDGNYHNVLNFYDRLNALPRVVNISDLKMQAVPKATAGTPRYRSGETLSAECLLTAYFSPATAAATAPVKQGGRK